MQTILTLKHCAAAVALALCVAGTAQAQEETVVPPGSSTASRDQVRSDAAAWRQAGLAQAWHGEATPDIEGPDYQGKYEHYRVQTGQARHHAGAAADSRQGGSRG